MLGDQARTPQFIETVHGRGYRFIAPVERLDPFKMIEFDGQRLGTESGGDIGPTAAVAVGLALRKAGDR